MDRRIEFFFDFGSPATYLAWTQLPALARRTAASIVWRPFLLGGVFKATGNVSPITVPAKGAHLFKDLERCAAAYEVPFRFNPHFPINTLVLMRGAVSFQKEGRFDDYVTLVFQSLWERGENLGDEGRLQAVLQADGFDAADFRQRVQRPEVKQGLIANTDEAVQRGAFGAPTFFVGGEMFFGQDRLGQVEAALRASPSG
jgi:2-hydroxychromene-2-carboxylate isomerase